MISFSESVGRKRSLCNNSKGGTTDVTRYTARRVGELPSPCVTDVLSGPLAAPLPAGLFLVWRRPCLIES
jgi:hypothetical protein